MANNNLESVLTQEALQTLRDDAQLYASVAEALGVKPLYMPKLIRENSRRFTEYDVLVLISEKLEKSIIDIVEPVAIPQN